jgi:23S rRNA maturation mini-RNase III
MSQKKDSIFIKLLKENTNIDENFIDTFFKKFKIGGELDYDIKDTDASKFLGISLINLRKRLNNAYSKTTRFIENVDYIRVKTGISNNINYMLNYACFEKLAMSGDSKQSEVVRMYFTKLREFITDNQRVIYQAMNKKNDLKIYNKMDTIYFFAADERKQDILKVGKSSKIVERLRNYNVGRIKEVELKYVALVKNPLLIEKCIKLLLKKKQVFSGKELFEINPKILKKVIDECYCKHVSAKDNKDLYDEISNLLGMYVYVKDKLNIKPFIIIGKNL